MPVHEYKCPHGHITEKFFKTFGAAEDTNDINCKECNRSAERVEFSQPLEALLYGNPEGYHKPSATKRYNTKLVSSIEGNRSAVG